MAQEQPAVKWSPGNAVCFVDGYGYSLTPNLKTTCIGKENDINKWLTGEERPIGKTARSILSLEKFSLANQHHFDNKTKPPKAKNKVRTKQ